MPERDNDQPKTTEQLSQELKILVQKTEFGTPQFQALTDLLDHQSLLNSWHSERRNLLKSQADESKLYWGSQIRITEMKIALLENGIRQNRWQLEGYSKAYTRIGSRFLDLTSLADEEARSKFPGNDEEQELYANSLLVRTINMLRDEVYKVVDGKAESSE